MLCPLRPLRVFLWAVKNERFIEYQKRVNRWRGSSGG